MLSCFHNTGTECCDHISQKHVFSLFQIVTRVMSRGKKKKNSGVTIESHSSQTKPGHQKIHDLCLNGLWIKNSGLNGVNEHLREDALQGKVLV